MIDEEHHVLKEHVDVEERVHMSDYKISVKINVIKQNVLYR